MEQNNLPTLMNTNRLFVKQVREVAELFGFETRNKYQISDEKQAPVAFAAEQGKGFFGFIMRQYLGHWRKFDVTFVTPMKLPYLTAHHPFRWYFERLEIKDHAGKYIGAIEKRFSILTKRFDVHNERGMTIMEVSSPIWKLWTFNFMHQGKQIASVQKKWSGFFNEAFTDKDNFMVEFTDPSMTDAERKLILGSAIFIDMMYFEKKQ